MSYPAPDSLDTLMRVAHRPEWMPWLREWVGELLRHQQSFTETNKLAWYLGDSFVQLLARTVKQDYWVYYVFCILVFLVCSPCGRVNLRDDDLRFLAEDVTAPLTFFLEGRSLNGRFFGHDATTQTMNTEECHPVAFVLHMYKRYDMRWRITDHR